MTPRREIYLHAGTPHLTAGEVDDLISGRIVMRGGGPDGQILPHKLKQSEVEVFQVAKERGWLEVEKRNDALANVWDAWCDAHRHPFIHTRPARGGNVEIRMDLLTYSRKLSLDDLRAFRDATAGRMLKGKHSFLGCIWAQLYVKPEDASEIARMLLEAACTASDKNGRTI